ncbi:MAG: hypothetical protein AAGC77_09440, partial [Pseudomonadota bacterium]
MDKRRSQYDGPAFQGESGVYAPPGQGPVTGDPGGAGALAVSIAILVAGAVFIAFAAITSPSSIDSVDNTRLVLPVEGTGGQEVRIKIAAPIISDEITSEEAVSRGDKTTAAISEDAATVDGGEAGTSTEPAEDARAWPRIKPDLIATGDPETPKVTAEEDDQERGFWPRLKPQVSALGSKTLRYTRPAQLGDLYLASAEDAPLPFVAEADLDPRRVISPTMIAAADTDLRVPPREVRVALKRGENFVDALKRAGVGAVERNQAAYAFAEHQNLRKLLPGQEFLLTLGGENQTIFQRAAHGVSATPPLLHLEFRPDTQSRVLLARASDGTFTGEKRILPTTTRTLAVAGRIEGSLYESARSVGAPDDVIFALADIFAYDVDFQREIFGGDEFEAIFEATYDIQGNLIGAGNVLYARLKWRGQRYEKGYYQFEGAADRGRPDYYDETGKGAKRLLMKTPVDGARLSSGFGRRRHPVLGYAKHHKGVDFAAPRGTPIKAAGDGVIER